jgi:uncharacterized protein YjiS (DUF1127 family)
MYALGRRSLLVAALFWLSLALSLSARRTHTWAKKLGVRLERHRAARVALEQLSAMSERELQDIGLSRSDIERVASQPLEPRNPFRVD